MLQYCIGREMEWYQKKWDWTFHDCSNVPVNDIYFWQDGEIVLLFCKQIAGTVRYVNGGKKSEASCTEWTLAHQKGVRAQSL